VENQQIIGVFFCFSGIFLLGILIFKGLTARRFYKSFVDKRLIYYHHFPIRIFHTVTLILCKSFLPRFILLLLKLISNCSSQSTEQLQAHLLMSFPKHFTPTQNRFFYYVSPSQLGKRLRSCWSKENSCGPQGYILGKGGDILLINGFHTCQPIRVQISLSKVTFIFQLSNRIFFKWILF
jgi:hypothetical protein